MYKVLLADDEPLTLIGLQSMISWADYDMQICGTARNGDVALEIISKEKPDIVIIDIKMPCKTGLETASICRELYGDVPVFILLTSFEEIQYLHEAIRLSAVDYLVKMELTKETLVNALNKAIDRLKVVNKNTIGESIEGISLLDNFYIGLLYDLFENKESFENQKKELRIETEEGMKFIVCYGEMKCFSQDTMELYASTVRMIKETLDKFCRNAVIHVDINHFAVVYFLTESMDYEEVIRSSLFQTSLIVKNYFSVSLSCSAGFIVNDLYSVFSSFSAARNCLSEKTLSSENDVIFSSLENDTYTNRTILEVKKYIKEHIREKLSLTDIASRFSFTPNYFSQLFTRVAGITITEFITIEKIHEAKKMLRDDTLKVYEISDILSFENAFYFSKVFKKIEGISPKEYQKNYSKNNKEE
jgi:two-component system response regulator YesN